MFDKEAMEVIFLYVMMLNLRTTPWLYFKELRVSARKITNINIYHFHIRSAAAMERGGNSIKWATNEVSPFQLN